MKAFPRLDLACWFGNGLASSWPDSVYVIVSLSLSVSLSLCVCIYLSLFVSVSVSISRVDRSLSPVSPHRLYLAVSSRPPPAIGR